MTAVLRIEGLRKTYVQHLLAGRRLEVLRGIELEVQPGEFVVVTGPSGCGKSTLLRCINRSALADEGTIEVVANGHRVDLRTAEPREVIEARRTVLSLATQFLQVVPRVSALDLVQQKGLSRADAADALERLGLPLELHDVPPATFSGGQRQILNLALVLASPRPLFLLDEVTAALDPARRKTALSVLREQKSDGHGVLAVFHDIPRLPRLVDRVVVIRDGRVAA